MKRALKGIQNNIIIISTFIYCFSDYCKVIVKLLSVESYQKWMLHAHHLHLALKSSTTISDKSPWDTLRQIAFSFSFDTYAILLPSHHVKHPPLPPKQCCFTEKYLCGLKTTLIRGGGGGKG